MAAPLAPLPELRAADVHGDEEKLRETFAPRVAEASDMVREAVRSSREEPKKWKRARDSDGIVVLMRDTPFNEGVNEGLTLLVITCEVDAPPRYVKELILRYELRATWDDVDASQSRVLRTLGDGFDIAVTHLNGFGPVSARQSLEARMLKPLDGGGYMGGTFPVDDDAVLPRDGAFVRGANGTGGFLLEPAGGNGDGHPDLFQHFVDEAVGALRCRITFCLHPNPGGSIPLFLVRRMAPKKAGAVLGGIRDAVRKVIKEGRHPAA